MQSGQARAGAVLASLLVVVGCSSESRPDAATWMRTWSSINSVIPDQTDLGSPPSESICRTTLAAVREGRADLFPTPLVTVDNLANEWIAIAETAFFECPPEGQDIDSFDAAYRELTRVADSVETALSD